MYDEQTLYGKVCGALRAFFRSDHDLLDRDVNERSITHKLAEHLQRQFENHCEDLKVDCEYNRHVSDIKRLLVLKDAIGGDAVEVDDSEARTVYPDIIVHQRGSDKRNLLVIEVKKTDKRGMELDRDNLWELTEPDKCKLRAFTELCGDYRYELGLLIILDTRKKQVCHVECFKGGIEHKKTIWDRLQGFRSRTPSL